MLWMYSGCGTKILSQNDTHVHSAECIRLHYDLSRTQDAGHGVGPLRIAPAYYDPGKALR